MAGIGPATSPLPRECSTTEPHGLLLQPNIQLVGAGDEARTRDIQFGKLKLYQLSYTRFALRTPNYRIPARTIACRLFIIYSILVEGAGFEPAYSERTDLQSVAFNHSATPPNRTRDYAYFLTCCQIKSGQTYTIIEKPIKLLWIYVFGKCLLDFSGILVPDVGIELTTFALQVRCSTNWANPAFFLKAWLYHFL